MTSPLHPNNTISMTSQCDIRPELLMKLQGKLQTSLETEKLLDIFFKDIQQAVLLDGISFESGEGDYHASVGKTERHKVTYVLQTHDYFIGRLTFQRAIRFREQELANLEGLLSTLVYPFRNAALYREALKRSV